MERVYTIALDTHCAFTEIGVFSPSGRVSHRQRCATNIPDLVTAVRAVSRPRHVVLEEGPLADWLWRELRSEADEVVVCDPRRNQLIAKDSDKDDPIDVEKLAQLYRGGYIKRVHHAECFDRVVFKRHVGLYHDSVRQRVRVANRMVAELRHYGVFVSSRKIMDEEGRAEILSRLPKHPVVRRDIQELNRFHEAALRRVTATRRTLVELAKKEPVIVRFTALPGVKWIRAATFFAYVDTPWRFGSKQALWKYLGIGLERRHSGSGPEQVQVPRRVHRGLKSAILGAAKSAIVSGKNVFAAQHERWLQHGVSPRNARRNVARSQAAVLWGMWKNGDVYRPEQVGVAAVSPRPVVSC